MKSGHFGVLKWARYACLSFALVSPAKAAEQNSDKPVSTDPLEVSLVAIGDALPFSELVEALGSDIPEGLYLTAARSDAFNESTFLAEYSNGPRRIDVWVDATERKHVRLYFADPKNARYALRTLEVSGEMNEMDLESLAQAISWSLRAFAKGSHETLSRSEAKRRLVPESVEPEIEKKAEATADEEGWYSSSRSFLTDFQAFYRVGLNSAEIPAVHGPGIFVGVWRSGSEPIWALAASAQWQLPAAYEQDGLRMELSTFAPRVLLQTTFPVSRRVAFGLQGGTGFDLIFSKAQALDEQMYTVREPAPQMALPLCAGVLALFKVGSHLVLNLQVGLEVYLSAPSFELETTEGTTPFVSPFPLRPTLAIGIGAL